MLCKSIPIYSCIIYIALSGLRWTSSKNHYQGIELTFIDNWYKSFSFLYVQILLNRINEKLVSIRTSEILTKKIIRVMVVWKSAILAILNYSFIIFSVFYDLRVWKAINTQKSVSSGIPVPRSRLRNTCSIQCQTHFSVFGHCDEMICFISDILVLTPSWPITCQFT